MASVISERAYQWHLARFPKAHLENVGLKLAEESGEVTSAINALQGQNSATGKGDVMGELADVLICVLVIWKRWFPDESLWDITTDKLTKLETPGEHSASLQEEG